MHYLAHTAVRISDWIQNRYEKNAEMLGALRHFQIKVCIIILDMDFSSKIISNY